MLVKPYFNKSVFPYAVSLLIDTGASFSCITQSLFDRLRNHIGIVHEKQQRPTATVANGKQLLSCGETVFDLVFNQNSCNAKISNIRFSIFPVLSSDLILGWEVIKHLNLHIREQGKSLGLDQIKISIGQEESSRRGALDLVTTHPEEATLVKSKNSGPLIWTPMTCSYSHCSGSSTVSILVKLTDDELQVAPEMNMLNYCDNISSDKVNSEARGSELTQPEIICSGNWN